MRSSMPERTEGGRGEGREGLEDGREGESVPSVAVGVQRETGRSPWA